MSLVSTVSMAVLAAASPSPTVSPAGPPDPSKVNPGVLWLVSWLLMIGAAYLLWRSMNKQMSRIRFKDPEDARDRRRVPYQIPHAPVDEPGAAPTRPATAWSPSPRRTAPPASGRSGKP
jgi:hypothetical protein